METHQPHAGPVGTHVSMTHPDWGPSFAGGIAALIAGPAMGLAVTAAAVWVGGAVKGWPTTFPSASSDLFPQLGLAAGPAAIAVVVAAFAIDASIRRCVFRRVARCEISLAAVMVSIPLSPGLWLITGIHAPLSWPFSVALGVAFLRWRSCAECAMRRPPISRVGWTFAAVTLAVGVAAGAALVVGGPHLATAADGGADVIGPSPSGANALSDWRAWPLNAIVGRRPTRVVYYRFAITTDGPIPITVRRVTAHASGPGLQVLATRIVAGDRPTMHYGDATTVRVTLLARRCPAAGPASMSSVDRLLVGYSVLDAMVTRTSTFVLPKPLRLTCPNA